jgi:fermentation-respiration switch protein FrsA (DUF1100 family)
MVEIILLVLSGLLGLIVITGFAISQHLLHPKVRDEKEVYQRELITKRFPEEFYYRLAKEEVWIDSEYGYRLSCIVLENQLTRQSENKHKIAVFCHGYKCSKTASVVYAKILMDLGYTAIIYDHRNHGNSDKKFTSMGYYEKNDLKTMIDWCYQRFGEEITIITHGESMGSATVLGHLAIDHRVTATISDCGYSDLGELLQHQLKTYFHLPYRPLLPVANVFLKLRGGFNIHEVSPKVGAIESKTPILFIHGDCDNHVPTWMSISMFQQRLGPKQLYLTKGAKHASACVVDYDGYCQVVQAFVRSVEDGTIYSKDSVNECGGINGQKKDT